jgi:hypothetical protein
MQHRRAALRVQIDGAIARRIISANARLHLKRSRTLVLVVSRGHHDNEIELRDDASRLPASVKRARPAELTPIEQGAAEPPDPSTW